MHEAAAMGIRPEGRLCSERGTTLVHVAVALVTLMGMLAFAVDRGIVWVSRGQAQNAADAGALAGAVARAWDEASDPPASGGLAETAALSVAGANTVWGIAGSANVTWRCPAGVAGRCARVEVYRNGDFNSASLPVIFAPILGITQQGVRAMATAVVRYGNTVHCMRPFAIPDKWTDPDNQPPGDEYNHWAAPGVEFPNPDTYGTPGAAWDADESDGSSDIGVPVTLEPASGYTIQANRFFTVGLPGVSPGGYGSAIRGCASDPVSIGQLLPVDMGGMGSNVGDDVAALVNVDPTATFNIATKRIENSCVPGCGPISPRLVPIIVFDVEEFQYKQMHGWTDCHGPCLRIVNILGLFVIPGGSGSGVAGHLMLLPGDLVEGIPSPPAGSNFLVRAQLIR